MSGPTPGARPGTTSYRAGTPLDWQERGACRQHDPEIWYTTGRDIAADMDRREAKRICRGCPVILECRRHALDNREEHGIWGGLDEDERRAARERREHAPETDAAPEPTTSKHAKRPPSWKAAQDKANANRRARADQARAELAAQIEELVEVGADFDRAARETGRRRDTLERLLYRAQRPDLIAKLKRAA